jgi:hypothetical protein
VESSKKNRKRKLKNSNGEWITDQTGMTGLVNNYFSTLYAKDPEVRPQEVSTPLEPCFTDVFHDELCKPFLE